MKNLLKAKELIKKLEKVDRELTTINAIQKDLVENDFLTKVTFKLFKPKNEDEPQKVSINSDGDLIYGDTSDHIKKIFPYSLLGHSFSERLKAKKDVKLHAKASFKLMDNTSIEVLRILERVKQIEKTLIINQLEKLGLKPKQ